MESKDEIKKDLEEFGIEEILTQYMMNPYAEELVVEYIKELKEELIEAYCQRGEMYMAGQKEWIDDRIEKLRGECKNG